MASKVRVSVKLDLDHELGHDHYQTWRSQLDIGFQLHEVTNKKKQYLAAAANLGENASYYLWQKFPTIPEADDPFAELIGLFDEYFGSQRSTDARLAELFSIEQQPGESIQAFRVRIEKEMRVCNLTPGADLKDVLGTVAVHLFARGLSVKAARKSVLQEGGKDLTAAAKRAQAVVLARETPAKEVEVSYAAPQTQGRPSLPYTSNPACWVLRSDAPTGKAALSGGRRRVQPVWTERAFRASLPFRRSEAQAERPVPEHEARDDGQPGHGK
eukprot:scpid20172/ scgid27637/ 